MIVSETTQENGKVHLGHFCISFLFGILHARACAVVIVVLDEAATLVSSKADVPRLAVCFNLFRGSFITVGHVEACDFSIWFYDEFGAVR